MIVNNFVWFSSIFNFFWNIWLGCWHQSLYEFSKNGFHPRNSKFFTVILPNRLFSEVWVRITKLNRRRLLWIFIKLHQQKTWNIYLLFLTLRFDCVSWNNSRWSCILSLNSSTEILYVKLPIKLVMANRQN